MVWGGAVTFRDFLWSSEGLGCLALIVLLVCGVILLRNAAQEKRKNDLEWQSKKTELEAYVKEHPEAWPFYQMVLEAEKKHGDTTIIPIIIPR